MNRLNLLLTLSSIDVILVTIERFSFTTQVMLQPYSFLRLHEALQIITLILFTVLIPTFVLREVTGQFDALKTQADMLLLAGAEIGLRHSAKRDKGGVRPRAQWCYGGQRAGHACIAGGSYERR